jgi:hypothetical protein
MDNESVLVPLGALAQSGLQASSITFGYILQTTSYGPTTLDEVAGSLVEKWRLLAGRLQYDYKVCIVMLSVLRI